MKDLTPETKIKFSLTQLLSIVSSILIGSFVLMKMHSDIMSELKEVKIGIQTSDDKIEKIQQSMTYYSLKRQLSGVSSILIRELNLTNSSDQERIEREIQRILDDK